MGEAIGAAVLFIGLFIFVLMAVNWLADAIIRGIGDFDDNDWTK